MAKSSIWFKCLAKLAGILDPNGHQPRDMQMIFWAGKKQLRAALKVMMAWQLNKIILAHGRWYTQDAMAELNRAFAWVLKS